MRGLIGSHKFLFMLHPWRQALLAAVSFLLAGCAMQSSVRMQPLSLDYAPPARTTTAAVPNTLMVYQFLLAPSVNPQYVILSEPGTAKSQNAVQRWRENPAEMITTLTLRDLGGSGLFARTVDQFSTLPYRYALEGTIRSLDGRMRNGATFAVLELEISLIDFEVAWASDKTIFSKSYEVEIPCRDSSPESIAEGLNLAVEEYSRRLRKDLGALLERKG